MGEGEGVGVGEDRRERGMWGKRTQRRGRRLRKGRREKRKVCMSRKRGEMMDVVQGEPLLVAHLLLCSVVLLQLQEVEDVWVPWLQVYCKGTRTLEGSVTVT